MFQASEEHYDTGRKELMEKKVYLLEELEKEALAELKEARKESDHSENMFKDRFQKLQEEHRKQMESLLAFHKVEKEFYGKRLQGKASQLSNIKTQLWGARSDLEDILDGWEQWYVMWLLIEKC